MRELRPDVWHGRLLLFERLREWLDESSASARGRSLALDRASA